MCNVYKITVNDWRLLCLRKITDQLNYSESHTVNLHDCDSIMEGGIAKKQRQNILFSSYVCSKFHFNKKLTFTVNSRRNSYFITITVS